MKNLTRTFLTLIIGVSIGFGIGFLATKYLIIGTVPKGFVCVTAKNESGHLIKSINLKHESGNINIGAIYPNDNAYFTFKSGDESSYNIVVTFDNDSILTTKKMYVEAGYKTTETIFNDHIKTEYK